jgi:hypothetical protein
MVLRVTFVISPVAAWIATGAPALTGRKNSEFPKYRFPFDPNHLTYIRCPVPPEGRLAIVTDAGRDAVDVGCAFDERRVTRTAKSCGPDASMLASSRRVSAGDGGKKADHRGERGISR